MDGVAVTRLPTRQLKAIDISLSVLEAGSLKSMCQKVVSFSWALQESRSQVCPWPLASLLPHGFPPISVSLLTWPSPHVSVTRFSSWLPRGSDG